MQARLIITAAALALDAGAASAEYNLKGLHTNDFRWRFEPISKYDSGCSMEDNVEGKCFGGSARRLTVIEAAKARSDNYILVDGGDQFQDSQFHTHHKVKLAAERMKKWTMTR